MMQQMMASLETGGPRQNTQSGSALEFARQGHSVIGMNDGFKA
jgi:hypothetical protein